MKVLIVSHNCFGTAQSMGKTLCSLFGGFDKDELMQLYFYPSLPDTDVCGAYFRITDSDAARSVWRRNRCGREIAPAEIAATNGLYESEKARARYAPKKGKGPFARWLRDLLWRLGSTRTAALKDWLRSGAPDVVFYALGDDTFSQAMACFAADFLDVPLVTYICDEFVFSRKTMPYGVRFWRKGASDRIARTVRKSARIVTICEQLGKAYEAAFGTPYTAVMTGSSFAAGSLAGEKDPCRVSYIGNFGLGRAAPLAAIAAALTKIAEKTGKPYRFTYYGDRQSALDGVIAYGGRLSPQEVRDVMAQSTLLVHAETFDPAYRARLRYSMSTKLADTLASGTCLFCYCPADTALSAHLRDNGAAVTADDPALLENALCAALTDRDLREKTVENALKTARRFHDAAANGARLRETLTAVIKGETV